MTLETYVFYVLPWLVVAICATPLLILHRRRIWNALRRHVHWVRFRKDGGLPVTFPAMSPEARHYRWTGLYGVQCGPWFFGAVRGGRGEPWSTPTPTRPSASGRDEGSQS